MTIQESAEMYLETILRLSEKRSIVRSIDIAHDMGFSKPSVSRAIKNLKENGYISACHPHISRPHQADRFPRACS